MENSPAEVGKQLSGSHLALDQTEVLIKIDREEAEKYYYPLGVYLLERLTPQARLLVAIAGPPGIGKTVFGAILAETINVTRGAEIAICIGLDGWHFPNSYLDSHFTKHNLERELLSKIKGAPETFDVQAAFQCLERIRNCEKVHFPKYSRILHDPVSDAGVIDLQHQIVLAEGNYWLLKDNPWNDFRVLFDVTIFLTAPPQYLIEELRQRHLRGAKGREMVEKHIEEVDLPNIEHVLNDSATADIVVHKADGRRIERIIFNPDSLDKKATLIKS